MGQDSQPRLGAQLCFLTGPAPSCLTPRASMQKQSGSCVQLLSYGRQENLLDHDTYGDIRSVCLVAAARWLKNLSTLPSQDF